MLPLRRDGRWLPDIFNDFFDTDWMVRTNATAPAINVVETDKEYRIEVAAPGMTREDFNIRINDENQLVVTMEKKSETNAKDASVATPKMTPQQQKQWAKVDKAIDKGNEGRYLRREFSYTRFQQAMILPENIKERLIAVK